MPGSAGEACPSPTQFSDLDIAGKKPLHFYKLHEGPYLCVRARCRSVGGTPGAPTSHCVRLVCDGLRQSFLVSTGVAFCVCVCVCVCVYVCVCVCVCVCVQWGDGGTSN